MNRTGYDPQRIWLVDEWLACHRWFWKAGTTFVEIFHYKPCCASDVPCWTRMEAIKKDKDVFSKQCSQILESPRLAARLVSDSRGLENGSSHCHSRSGCRTEFLHFFLSWLHLWKPLLRREAEEEMRIRHWMMIPPFSGSLVWICQNHTIEQSHTKSSTATVSPVSSVFPHLCSPRDVWRSRVTL